MNSKQIKILVSFLSIMFISALSNSFYKNKQDEKLTNIQIEVGQNFSLSKDTTLQLNNSYRSSFANYDKLLRSNQTLLQDIQRLTIKYPKQPKIKKLKEMLFKQNLKIDLIKRANSIVANSFYYIRYLPPKVFSNSIYKNEQGAIELRKLSRSLVDLSYDIKLADDLIFQKYENKLNKLKRIKTNNSKLVDYQHQFISHTTTILKYAKSMHQNINIYNHLELELNYTYYKIREELVNKHLEIKQSLKYMEIISIILLFIFVILIVRFIKLENSHKEQQRKLEALISRNIITSTTDLKGIITSVSDAYCTISGYTKEELIGQPHNIIRHQDMPKSAFKDMWKTIKTGEIWSGEVKNLKKDGEYYWVYAVIEPVFNSKGVVESYLAIRVDITDKIKLKEFSQIQEILIESQTKIANTQRDKAIGALKSKDEFLANMSHEIRTPLNAIIGFIELLKEDEQDKTKQNYLNVINSSSKSLLEIINDILDFSKIESGNLSIDKIDFNPTNEFDLTQKLFQARFEEKSIEFKVTYKNLPNSLNGDILRIKQVINNLLSNAIKFTPDNKNIYLDIWYKDNNIFVSIKDQGIGISKEYQDKIFEAFTQEDSSTTRQYGGTGLGLTISYNLVEAMGGELKLKSKIGVGSEFYFSIPIKLGNKIEKNKTTSIHTILNAHILLVEDNKANQMFMKVVLKKMGLTFDIAVDGVEAIKLFKEKEYDAILMDENMPNMGGIEATQNILKYERQNNLNHTPIVALTANALKGDREKFLEAGMDEYMTKPLDKNKLVVVLEKLIKKDKNEL